MIDARHEIDARSEFIADSVNALRRKGVVVGVSGGIDSSVTLGLAVEALGPSRVTAIALPEEESSRESHDDALEVCRAFGVELEVENIGEALQALGVYAERDTVARELFGPDWNPSWGMRVLLKQDLRRSRMPGVYRVEVSPPGEKVRRTGLRSDQYQRLFAAYNHKQRIRTAVLYRWAEQLRYAVLGTSNRNETFLGFFVRQGDGAWDICPITDLLKSDVRELASELGVPETLINKETTTDTFPAENHSQVEFFYGLDFDVLDPLMRSLGSPTVDAIQELAKNLSWTEDEVSCAIENLLMRHEATRWTWSDPIRFEPDSAIR